MWKYLQAVNKHMTLAIPAAMIAGFFFGLALNTGFLKQTIMPLTFLMVYPMMVNLKPEEVFHGRDFKAQGMAQFINFGLTPLLAYGLGLVFLAQEPFLALGLFLVGLIPTSGMTISWTGFAGGNKEAAIKMTVIGLTLGALLAPAYVEALFGASLSVDFWDISRRIGLIVLLPMVLGWVTQKSLKLRFGAPGFARDWAPKFPPLATLGVMGIVFVAMALKAPVIYNQPTVLIKILVPLVIFYAAAYALAVLAGRLFLERPEGIAVMYGTVMRNLSISLALAMNAFGEAGSSAALVVAVAFVIQVQSAAWSVKLVDFLHAPEPAKNLREDLASAG